jgi:transcriptional regulator with XRE-family HTH domain
MDWPTEIRTLMQDRNWTQRELAAKVGMSATYIGDVLGGEMPSPKLKLRVLDMRGYDLASAAVLRMILSRDVAEELVSRERKRASDSVKSRCDSPGDCDRPVAGLNGS